MVCISFLITIEIKILLTMNVIHIIINLTYTIFCLVMVVVPAPETLPRKLTHNELYIIKAYMYIFCILPTRI